MRPRVLVILGNYALNGQERGNIEVYRALAQDSVDSLFVTHAAWGDRHLQPYLDRLGLRWTTLEYARHFQKTMSAGQALRNAGVVLRGSRRLRQIAREYRPTHIHVANPHYILAVLPALLTLRRPVVYRAGDAPTTHHVLYRTLLKRFIIPRTHTFVCVSDFVRRRLLGVGVPEAKATVIHSVPAARPVPEASDVADRLGAGEGRTVVFLGQVSEHKGVHLLVEAAHRLAPKHPGLRVLVAGTPPRGPFLASLLARIADGPADVRLLGYVEDVDSLLAQADVHVAPSICNEAFGNVVLEAKRAAVPSVLTPDGGLPEMVAEPGRDAVVCDGTTAEAVAAGLDHYLSMDDDALREAGAAARRSLDALGLTEAAFRERWLGVLREAM